MAVMGQNLRDPATSVFFDTTWSSGLTSSAGQFCCWPAEQVGPGTLECKQITTYIGYVLW